MYKRISSISLAAIAIVAGLNSARAADLAPPPAPAPEIRPSMTDWTGPYIGGVLGGVCMETKSDYYPYGYTDANGNGQYDPGERNATPNDPQHHDMNGCGFAGGLVGGFNYQIADNFLIGLEGDWVWGGRTGDHTVPVYDNNNNLFHQRDRYSIKWMTSLRLRAGLLSTEKTLFYVTGGPAWLRGELKDLNTGSKFAKTHPGYVIGGGVEHAFLENFHVRAEYLYSHFKAKTYGRYCTDCDVAVDVRKKMNQFHTFRVGLTWNFPISQW